MKLHHCNWRVAADLISLVLKINFASVLSILQRLRCSSLGCEDKIDSCLTELQQI